jgi:hypothetical protein
MRALIALAIAAACLALAGVASAAAPLVVSFKPQAPGPKVTVKWPYKLVVTQGGKPVKGLLTATLVDPIAQVHQVMDNAEKPIKKRPFNGVFSDKILFPAEAKGFTLTLRFAVTAGKLKKTLVVKVTPK